MYSDVRILRKITVRKISHRRSCYFIIYIILVSIIELSKYIPTYILSFYRKYILYYMYNIIIIIIIVIICKRDVYDKTIKRQYVKNVRLIESLKFFVK